MPLRSALAAGAGEIRGNSALQVEEVADRTVRSNAAGRARSIPLRIQSARALSSIRHAASPGVKRHVPRLLFAYGGASRHQAAASLERPCRATMRPAPGRRASPPDRRSRRAARSRRGCRRRWRCCQSRPAGRFSRRRRRALRPHGGRALLSFPFRPIRPAHFFRQTDSLIVVVPDFIDALAAARVESESSRSAIACDRAHFPPCERPGAASTPPAPVSTVMPSLSSSSRASCSVERALTEQLERRQIRPGTVSGARRAAQRAAIEQRHDPKDARAAAARGSDRLRRWDMDALPQSKKVLTPPIVNSRRCTRRSPTLICNASRRLENPLPVNDLQPPRQRGFCGKRTSDADTTWSSRRQNFPCMNSKTIKRQCSRIDSKPSSASASSFSAISGSGPWVRSMAM